MSLMRYNTLLNDFVPASFGSLIDRFFNDAVTRSGGSAYSFVPRADVIETEKAYELHLAVPGMNKEDFKIDLNDNYLTISGERKFTRERNENHLCSIETQYGSFSRSFALPENVNVSKINARYVNGILEVTLPKDEKKTLKTVIKVD
ncbi:MAG: heat-shock protein [Cyclobacteriaceae bacterium]|nr:MAG: heat-shock protein [Cyclobacteriaceae bacterium]